MIETTVLQYLEAATETPTFMETPEDRLERWIRIEKTGSRKSRGLDTATLAIQSNAPTLYEAAQLNDEVKRAMDVMPETERTVFGANLNSDYEFTDPQRKERRYQAVYQITYKE